jgi:NDP-sugar pyrophosphorylase family protein
MIYAIIAAGEGSRLSQEGFKGLKPMVCINGEMLIDRLIRIFQNNHADSIIILINEHSEELARHLENTHHTVPIRVFVKSTPSSFHSFYELLRMNGAEVEEICLTTTDSIFDEGEFGVYINHFTTHPNDDGLFAVTSFVDDESPLYINFDEQHRITAITDKPVTEQPFVSGGIYCLRKRALSLVNVCMEQRIHRMRNFQKTLLKNNLNLQAHVFGTILDIDHVTDIEKAENFLKKQPIQH